MAKIQEIGFGEFNGPNSTFFAAMQLIPMEPLTPYTSTFTIHGTGAGEVGSDFA